MHSDAENPQNIAQGQSQSNGSFSIPTQEHNPIHVQQVTEKHILSRHKHDPNETPLDFIQRNTKQQNAQFEVHDEPKVDRSVEAAYQAATQQEHQTLGDASVDYGDEDAFVPGVEIPKTTTQQTEEPTTQQTQTTEQVLDDDDDPELPVDANAENFKKLRAKVRHYKKDNTEKGQTLEQLQEELEKYKTGKYIPEAVQELESRVHELSKYEKLHALKMSPEYKEKYIKPIQSIAQKLEEIGKDYGVEKHVMDQAASIQNRAELNRFLSNHFDEIGGSEVKQLINNLNNLRTGAQEAEQEPAKHLAALELEYEQIQGQQEHVRRSSIASRSRDAWGEAMSSIVQEGKAKELIFKQDDSAYNEKFVKPIVSAAAREYGKLVKDLADSGLEVLEPKVAYALARSVLLGHASAVSIESREAALRHAAEVEEASKRRQSYNRPTVGGFGGKSSGGGAPKPAITKAGQSADAILNSVLTSR